jgi:hypothetical protein
MDILNITNELVFDSSITNIEYRDHEAYAGTRYGNTDEIRIEIKNQDIYTLPCESLLYVEGKLLKADRDEITTTTQLVNNFLAHLMSEIRYKINDVQIDQTRHVGIASTLKGLASFSPDKIRLLSNGGWSTEATSPLLNAADGSFNVALPLNTLMGFFEDYTHILLNCKQELVILRSQNDSNAVLTAAAVGEAQLEASRITISKLKWKMPHVEVDDETKLKLLTHLRSDRPIMLGFRSWFVAEKPMPTTTSVDEWQLQAMTSIERPRYILVAFQTNRRNVVTANVNLYDHCNIRNIKAYVNGKCYPYTDYNLETDRKKCAMLYSAYTAFQKSYYGKASYSKPLLSFAEFITIGTMFAIDCSKQNESVKSASVDVRLEIESAEAFPAGTTAFCMIIHDRIVEYTPLTNIVRRHVAI